MANHKVLGDLLHILIIKESVEAKLVCRGMREERKKAEVAWGEKDRGMENRDHVKYESDSESNLKGAIWTQDPMVEAELLLLTHQMSHKPHR